MNKYKLLDADYDAIDAELVGPLAVARGKVTKPSDIAPPQGSPFLGKVRSSLALRNKSASRYRY